MTCSGRVNIRRVFGELIQLGGSCDERDSLAYELEGLIRGVGKWCVCGWEERRRRREERGVWVGEERIWARREREEVAGAGVGGSEGGEEGRYQG